MIMVLKVIAWVRSTYMYVDTEDRLSYNSPTKSTCNSLRLNQLKFLYDFDNLLRNRNLSKSCDDLVRICLFEIIVSRVGCTTYINSKRQKETGKK